MATSSLHLNDGWFENDIRDSETGQNIVIIGPSGIYRMKNRCRYSVEESGAAFQVHTTAAPLLHLCGERPLCQSRCLNCAFPIHMYTLHIQHPSTSCVPPPPPPPPTAKLHDKKFFQLASEAGPQYFSYTTQGPSPPATITTTYVPTLYSYSSKSS